MSSLCQLDNVLRHLLLLSFSLLCLSLPSSVSLFLHHHHHHLLSFSVLTQEQILNEHGKQDCHDAKRYQDQQGKVLV